MHPALAFMLHRAAIATVYDELFDYVVLAGTAGSVHVNIFIGHCYPPVPVSRLSVWHYFSTAKPSRQPPW